MNKLFASIVTILLLSACSGSEDTVFKVVSPSGEVDAILMETNDGATTSFGYKVFVQEASASSSMILVANFYGATRSESAYGVNLVWNTKNILEIQYYKSSSANLVKSGVTLNNIKYLITTKSGVYDKNAPSGGMLYNLKGRPHG